MQSGVYSSEARPVILRLVKLAWHIGDVIRKLREDRGWKQEALADEAKLHLATIVRVEAGKETKTPTIAALAKAFGLSVAQLYGLIPPQEPPMPQQDPRPADTFREGTYVGQDERRENLGPPPGVKERRRVASATNP